jgi:hypothetical protein
MPQTVNGPVFRVRAVLYKEFTDGSVSPLLHVDVDEYDHKNDVRRGTYAGSARVQFMYTGYVDLQIRGRVIDHGTP